MKDDNMEIYHVFKLSNICNGFKRKSAKLRICLTFHGICSGNSRARLG